MRTLVIGIFSAAFVPLAHGQLPTQPPKTWATCAACHAAQGAASIGPPLTGVVGRKAGSVAGFSYSRAMKSASFNWDDKSLAEFLADPQQAVPGNRMPFAGVSEPGEVAELVKYLKTLQ
ncbi:cytochrome c family protein [Variovorax sp. OV329]|uniref:c-type cytochrome n=1 Tax=Variovorax sp. OV329 TaxID=1882825 RepID=UPI0008F0A181|nr:c-type cytochrome [Variovorax sp. OV329]SFN50328.1 cytochrome c [Variovorax sp. OV329]